jgi:hypothetical protein
MQDETGVLQTSNKMIQAWNSTAIDSSNTKYSYFELFYHCSVDTIVCIDSLYIMHWLLHVSALLAILRYINILTFILFFCLLVLPTLASIYRMGVLVQVFRFFMFM